MPNSSPMENGITNCQLVSNDLIKALIGGLVLIFDGTASASGSVTSLSERLSCLRTPIRDEIRSKHALHAFLLPVHYRL